MRILVLSLYYWPDDTGIAVFARGRCEYLASRGHEVTVCTGMPFYPQWRIRQEYRRRMIVREQHDNVTILRNVLYVPKKVTSARRIVHEASFAAGVVVRAFTAKRPDLILIISPPLALGAVAILLSRVWHVPYSFHVADLQPDAAQDLGMLQQGRLMRALHWLERVSYKNAALVSTLTEGMRQRILEKGFSADKVVLFPDWADPSLYKIPLPGRGERFRREYGFGDQFLVVHAGNMGVKQGLEVVLGAAEIDRDRTELRYVLVGDGAVRSQLQQRARSLRLRNVSFLPLQSRDMFNEMMAATNVALVTQLGSVRDIVFPSKVLTLLAAGRPVIASIGEESEVARVLEESNAGVRVPPENPEELSRAIQSIQEQPDQLQTMGECGRAYASSRWNKDGTLLALDLKLRQLVTEN